MENKKHSLSTIFLVIAIILIIIMGGLLYTQKIEKDKQIAELENNLNKMQKNIDNFKEKNDLTSNIINSKDIYEKCEKRFSNVEYRRETGGSSGFFIKAGVLYSGEEDLAQTHSMTTGVEGKAKYVVPVDKQTGIAITLTENGKLFINKEFSNDFSPILEEYNILEIINIPNEDEHLVLADDGKVLKLDGTIFLDLLNESSNKTDNTANIELGNLDINSELVQNLYSKILKSNDGIMHAFEGAFYKEEKTTLNNLSNEEKLVIIIKNLPDKEFINFENLDESLALKLGYNPDQPDNYQHIHKDTIQVYSTEEIMDVAKKIFGPNVKLNIVDFSRISARI